MQSQHQPDRPIGPEPRSSRRLARLAMVLALLWPGSAFGDRLTVFGAESLKTALEQIAEAYEAKNGTTVDLSLAGSSLLARQLQYGAPADVFISANAAWMDWAQSQIGRAHV